MKLQKFDYSSGKRGRWFLYGFILAVVLMILINLFFSEAKYLNTESIKLAEGSISYKPYDFKIMAMYQENGSGNYEVISSIPTNGYKINEEKSYCTLDNINKDSNAILKTIGSKHTIENINQNDKCYLYFDKVVVSNIEDIINSKTIARRTDFSTTLTEDTTGTIFVAEDDYGNSFYFAGAVQDNWVKFAGFYWRIIRINGDGTLRMIYSGSEESGPAITGEATQIGTSAFNESYNDNAYVGYMYGTPESSTYEETHSNINDSTIKQYIDNWYKKNLINYESNIDNNAGFCNDRQPSTSTETNNGLGGTGKIDTFFGAYIRLQTNKLPSFKCKNNNDLFKTNIGLITADEVAYSGVVANRENKNNNFYLYTGLSYWTMSPFMMWAGNDADDYILWNGVLVNAWTCDIRGVRPVINIKADTTFSSGEGTASNPYVVS